MPGPRRLTGGPQVAPRVHSDLDGPAAGLWGIPAERRGARSEQSEEQESAEQPTAPRPQGHGCTLADAPTPRASQPLEPESPPSILLSPRPWGAEPVPGRPPLARSPPPGPAPTGRPAPQDSHRRALELLRRLGHRFRSALASVRTNLQRRILTWGKASLLPLAFSPRVVT